MEASIHSIRNGQMFEKFQFHIRGRVVSVSFEYPNTNRNNISKILLFLGLSNLGKSTNLFARTISCLLAAILLPLVVVLMVLLLLLLVLLLLRGRGHLKLPVTANMFTWDKNCCYIR